MPGPHTSRPSRTKKVMVVGAGAVGSAYAHTLMMLDIADHIGLIDLNRDKAHADALDLLHALTYTPVAAKRIHAAGFEDCADADVVAITANAPAARLEREDRLSLLAKNVGTIRSITEQVMASGFQGVFLVVSNPVDILARVVMDVSGVDPARVIGTGTLIETSRMRNTVADYVRIDPRNIHGYVLGEHGASAFTAWSNVTIGSLPIRQWLADNPQYGMAAFTELDQRVRDLGFDIFRSKGATTYGVAGGLARITTAVLRDENVILPVSTYLADAYGTTDLFIGVPAVVNGSGVRELVHLYLDDDERELFARSAELLHRVYAEIG